MSASAQTTEKKRYTARIALRAAMKDAIVRTDQIVATRKYNAKKAVRDDKSGVYKAKQRKAAWDRMPWNEKLRIWRKRDAAAAAPANYAEWTGVPTS